ncbi:MAG TPA: nucleoside-diphosphate sugar epimerase/dehydratase [Solirubrobacteraceae bacterium]|jgi:FlaA1/EpsC-like NDP-sugar epimerase|nr:nucleoside-diphosphate sugar epimerase/dehydratase [Solirubrobacteraceae bacterium]
MRRRLASAAIPLHRRSIPQLAVDGALVALAYYLAFQLRFDNGPAGHYAVLRARTIWWVLAGGLVVLVCSRVYQRRWRYSGQRDFEALARAIVAIVLLTVVGIEALRPVQRYTVHGSKAVATATVGLPNGVIVLFGLLCLLFLIGVRVLARMLYERRPLAALRGVREGQRGVLIVGAGDGGRLVLREIARNRGLGLAPVGFLDDDPSKRGLRIDGVRVRGDTRADLPRILDEAQVDEVLIAIPSAPGSTRARVVRECRARGISVRTLPTVFELLQDQGTIARQMREVRVEDVLGREPVHMELDRVGAYLAEETVLVTGAGGSIGAELCRQIARVGPRKIVLLDHAEDNLFQIERELLEERHIQPSVLAAVLADCKEEERMREIISEHRPTVVFHAAAYKHVGLMEANPVEAVRNNAIATRVVAHVAGQLAARRFVLVSTDKAVAPATVMGASKALAEFALDAAAARFPGTRFNAVRFGNVLGSSGSVVPIFERQIARGGPVTVTDERMTRYFMTIPEAVQLIIRSGSLICADGPRPDAPAATAAIATDLPAATGAPGAEVFVLDMGEPVRIVELARAMIDLSGLDPERDIDIEIVGRRAGEKLSEELFNDYERALPTPAEKIMLADRAPLGAEAVESMFAEIGLLVLEGDAAGLAAKVSALSPARDRGGAPGGNRTGVQPDGRDGGSPTRGRGVAADARGGSDADGGRLQAGRGDNGHPTPRGTPEPLVHSQD